MTTETRYAVVFDTEEAELTALFSRERGVQRVRVECGECGQTIREGGTTVEYQLCGSCSDIIDRGRI